ncbi:MAG: hypothetical protein Q9225_000819 [Loekoesia sp. 1 TL-2023]
MLRIHETLDCNDREGYLDDMRRAVTSALAPGTDLDRMSGHMLEHMRLGIDELDAKNEGTVSVSLWTFLCHIVTSSSTKAIYGQGNPFDLDPSLVKCFWTFKEGITPLMINVLPWLLAPEAYKSREALVAALEQYFNNSRNIETASEFIKGRYMTCKKHAISTAIMAQLELGNLIGVLGNTAPTLFWLLIHVYSNEDLLLRLRDEIENISFIREDDSGNDYICHYLNINDMQTSCPLMMSTYQEVLRLRSRAMSSRVVLHDTQLDERYLVRKGSFVQLPSYVLHGNPDLWGANVKEFDPERFLRNGSSDNKDAKVSKTGAFRAFGGGQSLCSGRHFATLQVMAAAAMILARYDMSFVPGSWRLGEETCQNLSNAYEMPAREVRMRMAKRANCGRPGEQWAYIDTVSKVNFSFS